MYGYGYGIFEGMSGNKYLIHVQMTWLALPKVHPGSAERWERIGVRDGKG